MHCEIGNETYFWNGKQVPGKRCIYCNKNTHPDDDFHKDHRMKCGKIKKQCQACFKVLNESARTHLCFQKNKNVEFKDYIEEPGSELLAQDQNVQAKFPTDRKCTKCQKSFDTYHRLLQHMALEHDIHFQFQCDLCDFKGNLPKVLGLHRQAVHGVSEPVILQVQVTSSSQPISSLMEQKVNENVQFNCEKCDKRFSRKADLDNHIIRAHDHAMKRVNVKTVSTSASTPVVPNEPKSDDKEVK